MKEKPDNRRIINDIDNLVGGVLDSLNGIAWKDDKDIISITSKKTYSQGGDSIYMKITEYE